MKPSIYSLTRQDMIDWAEENGEKKFRAAQIWEWLYRKTRPVLRRNDQPF